MRQTLLSDSNLLNNYPMSFPLGLYPVCLAPMVGLSHVALRELVRHYTPKEISLLGPTEMLNSRKLPMQVMGQTPETLRSDNDHYLCPQVLANEEHYIESSFRKLQDWGVSAIDINMGCPVQKALKHNYGVSLMGDADYAASVVKYAKKHSNVPVSVKLRAGLENNPEHLKSFLLGLQNAGADWLTLHPRLAHEKRRGKANWQILSEVKKYLSVPLVGNGDVQTAEDIQQMFSQTGVDGVMVGRVLTARPWLIWQWAYLEGHTSDKPPLTSEEEGEEMGRAILLALDLHQKYFPENLAMRKFKFFIRVAHVWLEFGNALESILDRGQNLDEIRIQLEHFFREPKRMYAKSDLRY